jgi:N-acetylglucosaminyldiphosphoundecaprenol N-acetyl-beta-D-mannosaminyltransferase
MTKNGKTNILGVNVSIITVKDILAEIISHQEKHERLLITHVHVMGLNLAYEQAWLRNFFNNSSICYCDGMGVKLAAQFLGHPLLERFTLPDWINQLTKLGQEKKYRFYFLGNPPQIAEKAATKLQENYPNLQIAGTYHGFFDKTKGNPGNDQVITKINTAHPDILMVGFGMPIQERWVLENQDELNVNVIITCGALFEYISGDLPRGPKWMTNHYLEWLTRIFISPQRYLKRYLRDNPLFLIRLVKQRIL